MEFLIVLAILLLVVLVVSAPLRKEWSTRRGDQGSERGRLEAERQLADLEAARDAKYREIRDAELDHRTGKLSDQDFEALDRTLRGEAIEILRELDRARDTAPATISQQ